MELSPVVLWVGLAVCLSIIEIASAGFFCMFFAVGAALAGLYAWFLPADYVMQTVIFFAGSVLSLLLVRPILRNMLNISDKPLQESNVQALMGQNVLVMETVEKYSGRVKVTHTGEIWTAYLASDANIESLAIGQEGIIEKVDGAKLAIRPKV